MPNLFFPIIKFPQVLASALKDPTIQRKNNAGKRFSQLLILAYVGGAGRAARK